MLVYDHKVFEHKLDTFLNGVIITLPIDLKEKLNNLAKDQNRTLTNLVVTILMEYVKSQSRH